ncbi:MAG: STAS/SEC14 domain-containing protein [Chryseolinea sp.]
MEQKIFESPSAVVYYVADKTLGKIVWRGSLTPEEYKKPFLALIDLAKKGTSVTRFMSDIRNQGVVSPESRKWFEKEMVPAAIANGLKRAAVISGSNAFKTYYINLILRSVNKFNLPFKIFNDEEKAIDFLMKES